MARLNEAGIKVFKVRGNHDAASRIAAELVLPPCVTLFGGRGDVVELGTYGPFQLTMGYLHTKALQIVVTGARDDDIQIADITEADPVSVAERITNTVRRMIDELARLRAELANLKQQLPKLEAQIGPFEQAAELAEARASHGAVMEQLRPKPKPPATLAPAPGVKYSIADADPVAKIDGTELDVTFRGPQDMPALRKAALAWYQETLRGSTILMKDGTEVRFSQRGRNKTVHGRGDMLLRAIPAIPEILRRGDVVFTEPGKEQRVEERRVIAAPVRLMGEVRCLAVSVHRQADGHWLYDLTFDNERTGAPAVNAGGLATREGPVPTLEGQRPRLAGDANTTDRNSVGEPASDFNLMVWEDQTQASGVAGDREIQRVRAVIDRHPLGAMVGRLIAAGRVRILSQAYDGAPDGVQGFAMPDGGIALVAPQLADGDVMPVLLHEIFHADAQPLIGSAAWDGLMDRLGRLHRQFEPQIPSRQ